MNLEQLIMQNLTHALEEGKKHPQILDNLFSSGQKYVAELKIKSANEKAYQDKLFQIMIGATLEFLPRPDDIPESIWRINIGVTLKTLLLINSPEEIFITITAYTLIQREKITNSAHKKKRNRRTRGKAADKLSCALYGCNVLKLTGKYCNNHAIPGDIINDK